MIHLLFRRERRVFAPCPRSSARACSSARLCKRRRRPWTQTRGATPSSPPSRATLPLRRRRRRSLAFEPSFQGWTWCRLWPNRTSSATAWKASTWSSGARTCSTSPSQHCVLTEADRDAGSTLFGDLSFRVLGLPHRAFHCPICAGPGPTPAPVRPHTRRPAG